MKRKLVQCNDCFYVTSSPELVIASDLSWRGFSFALCHLGPGPKFKAAAGAPDSRLCSSFWFPGVRTAPTDDAISLAAPDSRVPKLEHRLNRHVAAVCGDKKRACGCVLGCDAVVRLRVVEVTQLPKSPRCSAGCLAWVPNLCRTVLATRPGTSGGR